MNVVGMIAEYNPFHNGHLYHLEHAMQLAHADYNIVILSGDFTQRGAPALTNKYIRTEMALQCGADLVLELPVLYACHSAEYFARGAVSILNSLGLVTSLCFGSECGDINLLSSIAHFLLEEPKTYQTVLKICLKQGFSYPAAREQAFRTVFPDSALADLLQNPNNILGIEYCKALLSSSSKIKPITLLRDGASYHEKHLSHTKSSALAIRNTLHADRPLAELINHLPPTVFSSLENVYLEGGPLFSDDFSAMLHYKLLSERSTGYFEYLDVSKDLSDRIVKRLSSFTTFSAFCRLLKSKDLTYTRISRCLLHILLDIKKQPTEMLISSNAAPYARVLGFRKASAPLLTALKKTASIPLLSKLSIADTQLSDTALMMLSYDLLSHSIYQAAFCQKFHTTVPSEYSRKILCL